VTLVDPEALGFMLHMLESAGGYQTPLVGRADAIGLYALPLQDTKYDDMNLAFRPSGRP
jgi:hypothetical protein